LTTETEECLKTPQFFEASIESIKFLLNQESLALKREEDLVENCLKWAEKQDDPK
jgi:hypothetical protein